MTKPKQLSKFRKLYGVLSLIFQGLANFHFKWGQLGNRHLNLPTCSLCYSHLTYFNAITFFTLSSQSWVRHNYLSHKWNFYTSFWLKIIKYTTLDGDLNILREKQIKLNLSTSVPGPNPTIYVLRFPNYPLIGFSPTGYQCQNPTQQPYSSYSLIISPNTTPLSTTCIHRPCHKKPHRFPVIPLHQPLAPNFYLSIGKISSPSMGIALFCSFSLKQWFSLLCQRKQLTKRWWKTTKFIFHQLAQI